MIQSDMQPGLHRYVPINRAIDQYSELCTRNDQKGYTNDYNVQGHLSHDWADWRDNMQMCCLQNGEMILSGLPADQAALMGILNKRNIRWKIQITPQYRNRVRIGPTGDGLSRM